MDSRLFNRKMNKIEVKVLKTISHKKVNDKYIEKKFNAKMKRAFIMLYMPIPPDAENSSTLYLLSMDAQGQYHLTGHAYDWLQLWKDEQVSRWTTILIPAVISALGLISTIIGVVIKTEA